MPRRSLAPEKLGEKGETRFKELCADASLIATKSDPDTMGWDYLVEFPYPAPNPAIPLDKRPHPFEFKIQVKTVWDDIDHIDLTLSAAERLAKARLPSFIVVLSVNPQKNFTALYVFHMLDIHLERVLKRLRKAAVPYGTLKINHTELRFKLSSAVRLPVDGEILKDFIVDDIGEDTAAYFAKKQDQLANLGFGPLRYEGKFKVKAKSEIEMAEMFLGLRSIEIAAFEAHEIRFGIKLPEFSTEGGTISITPLPIADCKIIARNTETTLSIPGKLFLPAHRLSNGTILFRISANLFDIVVRGQELTFDPKSEAFSETFATTLELLNTLRFHRFIAEGGGELAVFAKRKPFWQNAFATDRNEKLLEEIDRQIRKVEMAASVLKAASAQQRLITLSDVTDKVVDLVFLVDLIEEGGCARINPITVEVVQQVELPPISEALLVKKLRFASFSIVYYAVIEVTLSSQLSSIVINVGAVSLRDIAIIDQDDEALNEYVEEAQLISGAPMTLIFQEIAKTP